MCPDREVFMQHSDVLTRPSRRPDLVVTYGTGTDHVADVRIAGSGPDTVRRVPLVLFLHGGFWRAAYDRTHTGPLTDALADAGFVVCTPEFRRVGQPGGGWPGTFDDIATAVAVLPAKVAEATGGQADDTRVILAGHSAGGHLALWAAADRRDTGRPRTEVVSLAGVCDLAACYRQRLDADAAGALMGGSPELYPDRYAAADPMDLVPVGAGITLLHGTSDQRVPWQYSRDFAAKAQAAGDAVDLDLIPDCGHFELIDPLSAAWPTVLSAFRAAAAKLAGTN
jgi:acetyl esterase/lipase